MLDKIIIIDFEDSFTFNIASVLYTHVQSIKVIGHNEFFSMTFKPLLASIQKHVVILGPGPGHPRDYEKYFSIIQKIREKKNIYMMGICLGHQMIGLMDGLVIKDAKEQLHGQVVTLEFLGKKRRVQRYNSLAIYDDKKEVDYRTFPRGISYQFHPESIGTESNDIFFKDLLEFIK